MRPAPAAMKILLIDGERRKRAQSGYGRIAAALAQHLPAFGHELVFSLAPDLDVCLYTGPPYSMRKEHTRGVKRVGFTMHELEELQEGKDDWPEILDRLDLVLTPTAWGREVWRGLGVSTPIEVVPLGVSPANYYPATGHRCVFLVVHADLGDEHSRENWSETLAAYYGAFRSSDRVLLRIKTWQWFPEGFEAARRLIAAGTPDERLPPIEVVDCTLTDEQMRELYLEASLFIKNANREGWSLPCTEAVACGTPVAATSIEPLRSHLPRRTRWWPLGDREALGELLRRSYREFELARQEWHAHTDAEMCRMTSELLARYFDPGRDREHSFISS
jgi:glycosyltransferase involved in cell wall biosynthesis